MFWTTRVYGFKFVPPSQFDLDVDIVFVLWDDKAGKPRLVSTASPRSVFSIPGWWFGDRDPRTVSAAEAEGALLDALATIPFKRTPETAILQMLTPEEMAKVQPKEREQAAANARAMFWRQINKTPKEFAIPLEPSTGTVDEAPFKQVGDVDPDPWTGEPPHAPPGN